MLPPAQNSAATAAVARARPALSVVVPCFNEAGALGHLHDRVSQVCKESIGDDYELVLVDDGSRDATWGVIASLCATDTHVVGVRPSRNHGQQLALTAGLRECRGDLIFI